MAKPILLIEIPINEFNDFDGFVSETIKQFDDYHVIAISKLIDDINIRVFYEKDAEEKTLAELKQLISEA